MAKNRKDECPIRTCRKSIQSDPSHFGGVPASPETMLRCVLYQMYVLASSVLAMKSEWSEDVKFRHPKLGVFTPNESLNIAALISFRILSDFLYNTKSDDDFSVEDFIQYGATRPTEPQFVGFESGKMFTKESINKFVAHLTWARINKPQCIPQPKFRMGLKAMVSNAQKLLKDADALVKAVCDPANPNRISLDKDGQGFRKVFDEALPRLLTLKI